MRRSRDDLHRGRSGCAGPTFELDGVISGWTEGVQMMAGVLLHGIGLIRIEPKT